MRIGILLGLLLLLSSAFAADSLRGENGTLSLLIAVPLTKDNQTVLDPGWFHMTAALLAVDHFNARNCSLVPELCTPSLVDECSVAFDVQVVDTGGHRALEFVLGQDRGALDAIVGPSNEIPTSELSVLATGLQVPLVVANINGNGNLHLDATRHPFTTQIGADMVSEMQFVAHYLQHVGRDNHVTILYNRKALDKLDILLAVLARQQNGFDQVRTFGYKSQGTTLGVVEMEVGIGTEEIVTTTPDGDCLQDALEKIKETGFRTIYVLPERLDKEAPEIGLQASRLGLNGGDRFWILGRGEHPLSATELGQFTRRQNPDQTILKGAAYLSPIDHNPLLWQEQSSDFYQRVQHLTPGHVSISTNEPEIVEPSMAWMLGTSYIYDAVLAIGLGACQGRNGTGMTGPQHLEGIRSVDFEGTSGRVRFGGGARRKGNTLSFGVVNLLPKNGTHPPVLTETLDPNTEEWIQHADFVYADGTTNPPALLRDPPEMNFLSPASRKVGLTLMGIALVLVFLSTVWIYRHQHHSVVIAAQPSLLYSLCLGSTMVALAILMLSYDESYVADQAHLSRICVANVWLDALGHIVAFGALFTKLWRVNRCMRYKTNNIEIWRVMWPCMTLLVVTVILLSAMTSQHKLQWERIVIDPTTGESIGICNPENAWGYMVPIYFLHFVPVIWTGIMAWKTLGIDSLYSESKWILGFILLQTQILVVAAPLVAILHEESANARFVTYSILMFSFPVSSMGFIILPKVVRVRRTRQSSKTPETANGGPTEAPAAVEAAVSDELFNPQSRSSAVSANLMADNEGEMGSPPRGPRMQVVTFD